MKLQAPRATLFPYTTLFRSKDKPTLCGSRITLPSPAAWGSRHWSRLFRFSRCSFCSACCARSEEHTSELQSLRHLVCRLLLEKKKHVAAVWRDARIPDDPVR